MLFWSTVLYLNQIKSFLLHVLMLYCVQEELEKIFTSKELQYSFLPVIFP